MDLMKVDLLVFRAVTAATMGITTALATTVTGGVLRRTLQTMPGTATCTTAMGMRTEAASVRILGFLLGVSGIKRFSVDYSTI